MKSKAFINFVFIVLIVVANLGLPNMDSIKSNNLKLQSFIKSAKSDSEIPGIYQKSVFCTGYDRETGTFLSMKCCEATFEYWNCTPDSGCLIPNFWDYLDCT